MDALGRVAEWFGRFLVRMLFSAISFAMALVAAFVVVMIVRVAASLTTGHQLGVDFVHPVFAPFWMAVGMWAMHGSEKRWHGSINARDFSSRRRCGNNVDNASKKGTGW